ncbi:MAG TPA: hypothetical protein VH482_20080 [Thermomicrobiales bacterium]
MSRCLIAVLVSTGLALAVVLGVDPGLASRTLAKDAPDSVTVPINELNGSGVHGTAVLTAQGDKTLVVMDITGAAGDHPDHIHRSTCGDPEPNPLYPLTDVVLSKANSKGHSETLVDVSLGELLADPHLILIHKSKDEINVYYACGNIVENATAMPNTGVGTATGDHTVGVAGSLAAVAALLALTTGWALRRRSLDGK